MNRLTSAVAVAPGRGSSQARLSPVVLAERGPQLVRTLPDQGEDRAPQNGAAARESGDQARPQSVERILVIEDDAKIASFITKGLEQAGQGPARVCLVRRCHRNTRRLAVSSYPRFQRRVEFPAQEC